MSGTSDLEKYFKEMHSEERLSEKEGFVEFSPAVMFVHFGNLLPKSQSEEVWRRARNCAAEMAAILFAADEERKANAQAVLESLDDPDFVKYHKERFGHEPLLGREPYLSLLKHRAGVV